MIELATSPHLAPPKLNEAYFWSIYGDWPHLLEIPGVPSYEDILNSYVQSPLGIHHAQQPLRYAVFAYDPATMLNDHGIDLDPARHGWATHLDTRRILQVEARLNKTSLLQKFSPHEIELALVHDIVHNVGENTSPDLGVPVIGDIPHGQKTDKDREVEAGVRQVIWKRVFAYMPLSVILELDDALDHASPESPVKALHRAGHALGFLERGVTALKIACQTPDHLQKTDRYRQSVKMGKTVTPAIIKKIEDKKLTEFVAIEQTLQENAIWIDQLAN